MLFAALLATLALILDLLYAATRGEHAETLRDPSPPPATASA